MPIELLPIPHRFIPGSGVTVRDPNSPARVTYLGDARLEKGFHYLPKAIAMLSATYIDTGRLRFVIQANASPSLEENLIAGARRRLAAYGADKVELIEQPLSVAEFENQLIEADLVVLPYQADQYRRRSSSILVQALVCGRPVVVPSGTWLSDCTPADVRVTFDTPDHLAQAIATAIERLQELSAAAIAIAPHWCEMHNAERLLRTLLAPRENIVKF